LTKKHEIAEPTIRAAKDQERGYRVMKKLRLYQLKYMETRWAGNQQLAA
jgi:hypothetical protein